MNNPVLEQVFRTSASAKRHDCGQFPTDETLKKSLICHLSCIVLFSATRTSRSTWYSTVIQSVCSPFNNEWNLLAHRQ